MQAKRRDAPEVPTLLSRHCTSQHNSTPPQIQVLADSVSIVCRRGGGVIGMHRPQGNRDTSRQGPQEPPAMYTAMRPKKASNKDAKPQISWRSQQGHRNKLIHRTTSSAVLFLRLASLQARRQKMRAHTKRATAATVLTSAAGRELLPDAILASCELRLKRSETGFRFLPTPLPLLMTVRISTPQFVENSSTISKTKKIKN